MGLRNKKVFRNMGVSELENFVNSETGEMLLGSSVRFSNAFVDNNRVKISFDRFMVLGDIDELDRLVGSSYAISFLKVVGCCLTEYNIVSNGGNYPHNKESLASYLGMSKWVFYKFINKMFEHRLLAYIPVDYGDGVIVPMFICNPVYGFRRTILNKAVLEIFEGENYFKLEGLNKKDAFVFGV